MTDLVLGPLLRYAGTESATFWVETSAPCEVEILGHTDADVHRRGPSLRPRSSSTTSSPPR